MNVCGKKLGRCFISQNNPVFSSICRNFLTARIEDGGFCSLFYRNFSVLDCGFNFIYYVPDGIPTLEDVLRGAVHLYHNNGDALPRYPDFSGFSEL